MLVLEVCLEYIGRRWREGELSGAVGVDEIGKKLVEVEMEVRDSPRALCPCSSDHTR